MVWLDNLLSIQCRGLLLTGATAFSQLPAPSPQALLIPTIPQSLGIALSPGPQEWMLQQPNPTLRQLLENLPLSDFTFEEI